MRIMLGFVRTAGLVVGLVGSLVTAGVSITAGARLTTVALRSLAAFALFAALGLGAAAVVTLSGGSVGQEKKDAATPKFDYLIPPELPAGLGSPGVSAGPGTRRVDGPDGSEQIGPGRPIG